jgi:hypothetical protein
LLLSIAGNNLTLFFLGFSNGGNGTSLVLVVRVTFFFGTVFLTLVTFISLESLPLDSLRIAS